MLDIQRRPVLNKAQCRWHSLCAGRTSADIQSWFIRRPVQRRHGLCCPVVRASTTSGSPAGEQQTKKQYARRARGKFDTPAEKIDKQLFRDIDPSDPLDFVDLDASYASTKADVRRLRTQRLQELYGEHVSDGDVRLYLSKRERNRQRPHKRGDFPPDDSFDRPQTFLKLAPAFQEVVLAERAEALSGMMAISKAQALALYRQLPGMLCYSSIEVAYRVKGLCRALHMGVQQLLPLLARDPRLAFLDPEVVEARCGQVAKVCSMKLPAAAHLLAEHGDVLLARNNRLLRRIEELAVSFRCSTAAALHVLCGYPSAATLERATLQQRLLAAAGQLGMDTTGLEQAAAGEARTSGGDVAVAVGAAAGGGPVRALFPGLARQQAEQLWGLLAGCPALAGMEPQEVEVQLEQLGCALHLGRQEVQAACRRHPWLLAADPAAVAARLQLLLYGLPELAAAGKAGGRALRGSSGAKKAKLMAMLEAGAAADRGQAEGSAAARGTGVSGAGAASGPAGHALTPTEASRLLPALQALGSCQGLLQLGLQELQGTLSCLVTAAAAVARRSVGVAHQYVLEAVLKQPQLLLLQLQQQPAPQLVLRTVAHKATSFNGAVPVVEQQVEAANEGDGQRGEAWQQALRTAWRQTQLPLRALLQELHQLHQHVLLERRL